MKVALVTSFPRELAAPQGGVEAVSVNLVKALSELEDIDMHVVTFDSTVSKLDVASIAKFKIHRLPAPSGSVLVTALTTGRRIVKDYLKNLKPEVVHSHDTYGLMVIGLNLPRVFTIHGFIYKDTLVSEGKFSRLRAMVWKRVETRGWADHSQVIAISPYVRERISSITKGNIYDIENPIDESFFKIERTEQDTIIFSAAAISPRKNTLALVKAIQILVNEGIDVNLRLAGKMVDSEYGKAVQEEINTNRLRGKVSLLGSIDMKQVRRELAQASVFALVSLEENAPLGIAEAMAAGVPVVTSNRCGMPYMVRNAETGFLIDPNNPKEIAYFLAVLLKNSDLRKNMGERAREIASEKFHPAKVADKTCEVYREALRSGSCHK